MFVGHPQTARQNREPFAYQEEDLEQSIASRFQAIVGSNPDAFAYLDGEHSLTYAALNGRANWIAYELLKFSVNSNEPVMVMAEDPVDHLIAQLGILKAGRICVPSDVSYPDARLCQILEDSRTDVLLTTSQYRGRTDQLIGNKIHQIFVDDVARGDVEVNPPVLIHPDAPAYIIYTSGSTGQPKGIVHTQRSLLHAARLYHLDLNLEPGDRLTTTTSLAFANSVWGMMGSLLNGATYIPTRMDSPQSWKEWMARDRVTVAQLIVSPFREILHSLGGRITLPNLRLVYTGGEALHKDDLRRFIEIFPKDCRLVYSFGLSEAGIVTHLPVRNSDIEFGSRLQQGRDSVFPSGYPVGGKEVLLSNDWGADVSKDREGEIVIRSRYLSLGYWRDPSLTAWRFQPDPSGVSKRIHRTGDIGCLSEDGCLTHLGRNDRLVKVRGFRVNLAEVEDALLGIEGVASTAVVANDSSGETCIFAYIEREAGVNIPLNKVRQELAKTVPQYMIPSSFTVLDSMPRTGSGKVDWRNLPDPNKARPEMDGEVTLPTTGTEILLCHIWEEVLELEQVGINDDFLSLGGHSLKAYQLLNRINPKFQADISVSQVFNYPTVAAMAEFLEERLKVRGNQSKSLGQT